MRVDDRSTAVSVRHKMRFGLLENPHHFLSDYAIT